MPQIVGYNHYAGTIQHLDDVNIAKINKSDIAFDYKDQNIIGLSWFSRLIHVNDDGHAVLLGNDGRTLVFYDAFNKLPRYTRELPLPVGVTASAAFVIAPDPTGDGVDLHLAVNANNGKIYQVSLLHDTASEVNTGELSMCPFYNSIEGKYYAQQSSPYQVSVYDSSFNYTTAIPVASFDIPNFYGCHIVQNSITYYSTMANGVTGKFTSQGSWTPISPQPTPSGYGLYDWYGNAEIVVIGASATEPITVKVVNDVAGNLFIWTKTPSSTGGFSYLANFNSSPNYELMVQPLTYDMGGSPGYFMLLANPSNGAGGCIAMFSDGNSLTNISMYPDPDDDPIGNFSFWRAAAGSMASYSGRMAHGRMTHEVHRTVGSTITELSGIMVASSYTDKATWDGADVIGIRQAWDSRNWGSVSANVGAGTTYDGVETSPGYRKYINVHPGGNITNFYTFASGTNWYSGPVSVPAVGLSGGSYSWTDSPYVTTSIKIRKQHIEELRTNIDLARASHGLPTREVAHGQYTNPTIVEFATKVRTDHINELREALEEIDPTRAWSLASTPVLNGRVGTSHKVRAIHINELRDACEDLTNTVPFQFISAFLGAVEGGEPDTDKHAGLILDLDTPLVDGQFEGNPIYVLTSSNTGILPDGEFSPDISEYTNGGTRAIIYTNYQFGNVGSVYYTVSVKHYSSINPIDTNPANVVQPINIVGFTVDKTSGNVNDIFTYTVQFDTGAAPPPAGTVIQLTTDQGTSTFQGEIPNLSYTLGASAYNHDIQLQADAVVAAEVLTATYGTSSASAPAIEVTLALRVTGLSVWSGGPEPVPTNPYQGVTSNGQLTISLGEFPYMRAEFNRDRHVGDPATLDATWFSSATDNMTNTPISHDISSITTDHYVAAIDIDPYRPTGGGTGVTNIPISEVETSLGLPTLSTPLTTTYVNITPYQGGSAGNTGWTGFYWRFSGGFMGQTDRWAPAVYVNAYVGDPAAAGKTIVLVNFKGMSSGQPGSSWKRATKVYGVSSTLLMGQIVTPSGSSGNWINGNCAAPLDSSPTTVWYDSGYLPRVYGGSLPKYMLPATVTNSSHVFAAIPFTVDAAGVAYAPFVYPDLTGGTHGITCKFLGIRADSPALSKANLDAINLFAVSHPHIITLQLWGKRGTEFYSAQASGNIELDRNVTDSPYANISPMP